VHFAKWLKHSASRDLLAALCLLGFVLVLQHRSVWVSVLGALVVVMWHLRTEVSRKAFPLIVIGLTTLSMVAIMVALNPDSRLAETILKSAVSVTESQGTHMDRLLGWQALLNDFVATASPHQWLVGKPYGSGFARWVLGHLKEYAPHNFYVLLLLRVGIVGILLLMTVHLWLRRRVALETSAESDGVVRAALLGLLAAFLLYYIPYQGVPFQGALYGVLIAVFGARVSEGAAAERSTLEVVR
jgi:O-antigen ligase